MSGSGRGGNNRRKPFKRRDRTGDEAAPPGRNPSRQDNASPKKSRKLDIGLSAISGGFKPPKKAQADRPDRLKWTPVKLPTTPLPSPNCPVCGKPIKDISAALTDKVSALPAHFDCVLGKVAEAERLPGGERLPAGERPADGAVPGKGDVVSYIGGGRFGVIHYANPHDAKGFKIKKIIEWEDKENRADWRQPIADRFSVT